MASNLEEAVNDLNKAPKIFYEKTTSDQTIQEERLDHEIDIHKLFTIVQDPVFIDRFLVAFPKNDEDGIDFYY